MTIRKVSLLPLDVKYVKQVPYGNLAGIGCDIRKWLAVLLAWILGLVLPQAVWAEPAWVYNEAQWGPPGAPFLFPGEPLFTAGSFGSSRPMLIGDDPALIHVRDGAGLHLSGPISNDGVSQLGLEKRGAGTLTLSGQNTYKGNTWLREGTLRVMGESALGRKINSLLVDQGSVVDYAPDAIVFNQMHLRGENSATETAGGAPLDPPSWELADSVQWRVDQGVAVQAGNVLGSVPIVKQGPGTLRLTGIAGYPFFITVNQGALAVDWLLSGSVRVNRDARLEGSGTVRSVSVLDGGKLSPGSGVGDMAVLTVMDKLEFKPGAAFEVDANVQGQADFVQVAGKALLDGQVMTRAQAGDWRPNTRYTLLQAANGLDGTRFASATVNLPFLTPSLSYDDQAVYLSLERNGRPLDEAAETPTEDAVADAVDDGGNPAVRDDIVAMDLPQAREAFGQLSGSWLASIRSGLLEDSRFLREAVMRNVALSAGRYARTANGGQDRSYDAPRAWGEVFYSAADRAPQGGTPADSRDIGGMVLGIDRPVKANWRLGGFLSAQRSQMRRRHVMAEAGIDSLHAGLSLAGRWRDTDIIAGVAQTWNTIRSLRRIAIAGLSDALSGKYRGRMLQVFSEIVAPLRRLGEALELRPFARLAWVRASTGGFVEQGGASALTVLPQSQALLFSTIGLRAAHTLETPIGVARVYGEMAWRHAGGRIRAFSRQRFRDSARQTVFESEGLPVARRAWSLQLGVAASLGKNASLGMAYTGQFAAGRQDHGARLDLAWRY